jgi:two-component SAPR family response regulator
MEAAQLFQDPESLDGISVVIVEDDYFVANDLAALLKQHGAQVIGPVPDVSRAKAIMFGQAPDCLLLDVNLKGEFVFDLAQEQVRQGQAVVFTTGYDASILPAGLRDVPCLQKPIDIHALVRVIQRQVAARRPAR